jgi:hypothetical protein
MIFVKNSWLVCDLCGYNNGFEEYVCKGCGIALNNK